MDDELPDAIDPGNHDELGEAEVEHGVAGVVVEEIEHEDTGGEAAGETTEEGNETTEDKNYEMKDEQQKTCQGKLQSCVF